MMEGCKWRFAKVDGINKDIADAVSGERGICPLCGADMVAKVGDVRVPHWSHVGKRVCDDWYQPKGPWHLYWQNKFPKDWQEVVVLRGCEKHIADIKTINGIVVEVQWSPIAIEEIREREQFYDKMIWIVAAGAGSNNKRLFHFLCDDVDNRRQSPCIWRTDDVFFERVGWLHCGRPVFVDVDGTQDSPASDGDLYYILPNKDGEGIFITKVRRSELIVALRSGMTKDFFVRLKRMKDKYIEEEKAKCDDEIVRIRAEQIENRQKWELEKRQSAEPFLKYSDSERNAIAFANKEFHYPPRCALTLGWVDAYLIIEEFRRRLLIKDPQIAIAPYGRVAVHLAERYSRDEYEQDCAQARRHGVNVEIESYETLAKYRDKMIACVDYLVKRTDRGVVLTFRDPERILKSNGKAYPWGRSERTFWALPERTQEYLGSVDPESHAHIWL